MNNQNASRKYAIIVAVMLILAAVYAVKLFSLQVISKDYKEAAKNNALRQITEHPDRGLIYDRNDSLLVFNDAAYDLMVVPKELRTFDTADLCRILDARFMGAGGAFSAVGAEFSALNVNPAAIGVFKKNEISKAQTVLLSEDFNQGFPSTWYNVDADGDGNIWGNFAMTGHSGAETDSCATSKSYDGATESALHPDNWLITPAVTIPAGSYSMLSFWVCAQDASWPSEHYGVYVTTSNDYLNTNNYTLLFEETLDANGGARAQGAWKQKTAVLNAYAGQTVHIAFRHFNCSQAQFMAALAAQSFQIG